MGLENTVLPGEVYEHYKNKHWYQVLAIARDAASTETLVVYKRIHAPDDCSVWVRPYTEFIERVQYSLHRLEGSQPRFRLVADEELRIPRTLTAGEKEEAPR